MKFNQSKDAYQIKYVDGKSISGTEEKSAVNGLRTLLARNAGKIVRFNVLNNESLGHLFKNTETTPNFSTLQIGPATGRFEIQFGMKFPNQKELVTLLLRAEVSR